MPEQAAQADNSHLVAHGNTGNTFRRDSAAHKHPNIPRNPNGGPIGPANAARWDWSKRDYRRIIAATKIIKRLQNHTLGLVEMQNSAVRAGIALLDRVVPTVQSVEVKGELNHRYVLEVPSIALSSAEWEAIDTKLTPALPEPTKTKAISKR